MRSPLRVLFLAAEAHPFVKIGGLGDVAGSLPRALKARYPELDIRLVIPFHGAVQCKAYDLHSEAVFEVPHKAGNLRGEALSIELDGLQVSVISGASIPKDVPVYSGNNAKDARKYIFFSLAALEMAKALGWQPDVIHANDWHTAAAVYAMSQQRMLGGFYEHTTSLLGLHNLPYMGYGAGDAIAAFGLPPASGSSLPDWADDALLPLGLLTADQIVAVSPHYAEEILTPEFGVGLDEFLKSRRESISGILNGIDTDRWDPTRDKHLPSKFNIDNLQARRKNKFALQSEFDLVPNPRVPLISMVSRLEYQKGIDLIPDALRQIADRNWQAILLGTGDSALEMAALQLETEFPGRVRTLIRYDSALSRKLFGGSDLILIPSRYEPCGLTQMIAMRYGCVPVARATGGLADTIQDMAGAVDNTGFLFGEPSSAALAQAILRAIAVYNRPEIWNELQRNGMRQDFSWQVSATQYMTLYKKLTQLARKSIGRLERV